MYWGSVEERKVVVVVFGDGEQKDRLEQDSINFSFGRNRLGHSSIKARHNDAALGTPGPGLCTNIELDGGCGGPFRLKEPCNLAVYQGRVAHQNVVALRVGLVSSRCFHHLSRTVASPAVHSSSPSRNCGMIEGMAIVASGEDPWLL